MQLVVVDSALREATSALPADQSDVFRANFKQRARSMMHNLVDRLMANGDPELTAALRRILEPAFERRIEDGRSVQNLRQSRTSRLDSRCWTSLSLEGLLDM